MIHVYVCIRLWSPVSVPLPSFPPTYLSSLHSPHLISLCTFVICNVSTLVQPLVMMTFVLQNGQSPLFTASSNGRFGVVMALIKAEANVNQGDEVGT